MRSLAVWMAVLANACTPSPPALRPWSGSGMYVSIPSGWTVRPITDPTNTVVEFDATSGTFGHGDLLRITCARIPFGAHASFSADGGSHVTDNALLIREGHFELQWVHRCDPDSCDAPSDVEARLRALASAVMATLRDDGCAR